MKDVHFKGEKVLEFLGVRKISYNWLNLFVFEFNIISSGSVEESSFSRMLRRARKLRSFAYTYLFNFYYFFYT